MLYLVSSQDPDCYNPTLLEGPEVENWKEYCESFNEELIQKSLNSDEYFIDEVELKNNLISILKEKGYKEVNPIEYCFTFGEIEILNDPRIKLYKLEKAIEEFRDFIGKEATEPNTEHYQKRIKEMEEEKRKILGELNE